MGRFRHRLLENCYSIDSFPIAFLLFNLSEQSGLVIPLRCTSKTPPPFSALMDSSSSASSAAMEISSFSSSDAMETSSSSSSHFSYLSYPSSYSGSTPEYDLAAVAEANARRYEALAPEWWEERDWVSSDESEDEPLTDGADDLQFLVAGALMEESDDD